VVLASGGYPGHFEKGYIIRGLEEAAAVPDVQVFHAGTRLDASGRAVTDGGRVLSVTALGDTLEQARERAYQAAACIQFSGVHYRKDIATPATRRGPFAREHRT
jgi:phosphoribosylamine--glycine ligase